MMAAAAGSMVFTGVFVIVVAVATMGVAVASEEGMMVLLVCLRPW